NICCGIATHHMVRPSEIASRRWASRRSLRQHARRECLDHIIIFDERHLRGVLSSYFHYYHRTRTHPSLDKDCPETRPIHPPAPGKIIPFPEVGGLHHRYERLAA